MVDPEKLAQFTKQWKDAVRELEAQKLTGIEAYHVMRHFLETVYSEMDAPVGLVLGETQPMADGGSGDPICMLRWSESVKAVLGGQVVQ